MVGKSLRPPRVRRKAFVWRGKAGFDPDQPRDERGRFGEGGSADTLTPAPSVLHRGSNVITGKPAAAAVPKKKYGKSKAKVYGNYGTPPEKVNAALKKMFGANAPRMEDMASAVGAPDDAEVGVSVGKDDAGKEIVEIYVKHKDYVAQRHLFKNDSGVHMKNDEFWMHANAQGNGIGTEVFGRQVEQCQEMGIDSIRCHAAKENPQVPSKPHNGYYTWPRMGYDAEISANTNSGVFDNSVHEAIRKKFPNAVALSDVMATPEGREWWKANGGEVYKMTFDLFPGSRSMAIFEAYQAEREAKKASK